MIKPGKGVVKAEPAPIELDFARTALVIIDMQRDFLEPGGFGETLGNDVSQLARAVKPVAAVLAAAREAGLLVIHTREGHLPDLSDAPPAKVERGAPSLPIGIPAQMGAIPIRAKPATTSFPALSPPRAELTSTSRGRAPFSATELAMG